MRTQVGLWTRLVRRPAHLVLPEFSPQVPHREAHGPLTTTLSYAAMAMFSVNHMAPELATCMPMPAAIGATFSAWLALRSVARRWDHEHCGSNSAWDLRIPRVPNEDLSFSAFTKEHKPMVLPACLNETASKEAVLLPWGTPGIAEGAMLFSAYWSNVLFTSVNLPTPTDAGLAFCLGLAARNASIFLDKRLWLSYLDFNGEEVRISQNKINL